MNDFDDLSDLDEVFGPLRSSATPAELSQQEAVLQSMVRSRRTTEGKHMFTSRRARVATLVAAGVLGFGGMAAASPNFRSDQSIVRQPVVQPEPVVEPETVEPESVAEVEPMAPDNSAQVEPAQVEPADAPPADVPRGNDSATPFDEATMCVEGGNHGATVSAVARGELGDVSVSDAARSSCGKTDKVDKVDGDDPESEVEIESEAEVETESESAQERPGRGKGAASNGNPSENSNGKANGRGAPGKRGD